MWFGYRGDNNWYPVPVERVHEILKMNSQGVVPETLVEEPVNEPKQNEFVAQVEGSLERLDDKYKSKKKKKKKKKPGIEGTETRQEAAPHREPRGTGREPKASQPQAQRTTPAPAEGRSDEAGQRPKKPRPFKNKGNKEGRENREGRPNREERPNREGDATRPPRAEARPEGQPLSENGSPQPKRHKSRRPNRGPKPNQPKPPRTDA
jgi:hypothetical protein